MDDALTREAFFQSGELALQVMSRAEVADRWSDASALEGFTVGGIASHLYAATRRFEVALDEDLPDAPKIVELAEFYGRNRVEDPSDLSKGLHPMVREDAERRAAHGPEALAERFRDLVSRLETRLPSEPPDRLVPVWTIPGAATSLRAYLTTRVVELVVHTDDLAVSAGVAPLDVPARAASAVIEAFVEMARARSGDLDVIRAFARRERAEEGTLRVL